jgi:hypothetical protein
MRKSILGLAMAAMCAPALGMARAAPAAIAEASVAVPDVKVRRGIPTAYSSHPGYRSKGKQAKPRKRPNRRHISRRVRRAHRRAKAA